MHSFLMVGLPAALAGIGLSCYLGPIMLMTFTLDLEFRSVQTAFRLGFAAIVGALASIGLGLLVYGV